MTTVFTSVQRPGAFAMYLEPWHFDIFDFLELKKNTGKEEQRARDLFYALWIPDLFMKRVETNGVSAAHKLSAVAMCNGLPGLCAVTYFSFEMACFRAKWVFLFFLFLHNALKTSDQNEY